MPGPMRRRSVSLFRSVLCGHCCWCRWCFFLWVVVASASEAETDLYKLLGVARSASTQEIKKAYRRKALDTHPDKNKNVPAEEAAEAFQKVVHAFEVLSDASSRGHYDRTGNSSGASPGGRQQGQQNSGGFRWTFRWNTGGGGGNRYRRERPKLKDRFDVKQSQSRILHIVSMEQLELIMTTAGENGDPVLERNLLICFYTPPLEKHVMEEMVYPWPFAAMSSQKIWWEDLLQTTVVRYRRSNELTEFFGIPDGDALEKPIFLFGKRGQKLRDGDSWEKRRLATADRKEFDSWVWDQLMVPVVFVNKHDHPVELYWIRDTGAFLKDTIEPNGTGRHTSALSHEWFVRDARTDTRKDFPGRHKLTDNTRLYGVKIVSDTRGTYAIPRRTCFDLSGHCPFWNRRGNECSKNPSFMHEFCRLTCELCRRGDVFDDGTTSEDAGADREDGGGEPPGTGDEL
mmetsp:Transcript_5518/g.12642  ORF Transcript_5518/g.12642 Transcript_5518/m.12642 type:complete len:457 (-) Transcript_5518:64-1434(-)